MVGGPTGFRGAERYQYPARLRGGPGDRGAAGDEEGRQGAGHAHRADARLRAAAVREGVPQGLALDRRSSSRRRPASRSSSSRRLRRTSTGRTSRNASSRNEVVRVVTFAIEEMGDFAEAGPVQAARRLRRQVPAARGATRSWGFAGGEQTVDLFTKYNGKTYTVAFDNDTQPFFYRGDMMDEPQRAGKAFSAKYGRSCASPETWEEHAQIAEFFTRPTRQQLYGDISHLAPFWSAVNWNERFVSAATPNKLLLQAGRLGQRQHAGRHPRVRGDAQVARLARAGPAGEGLVRRSTRSWEPATASWARRSRTSRRSSRATRPRHGERRQVHPHGPDAGPQRRRQAGSPAGDLLQHHATA